jgi:hypothetical protein
VGLVPDPLGTLDIPLGTLDFPLGTLDLPLGKLDFSVDLGSNPLGKPEIPLGKLDSLVVRRSIGTALAAFRERKPAKSVGRASILVEITRNSPFADGFKILNRRRGSVRQSDAYWGRAIPSSSHKNPSLAGSSPVRGRSTPRSARTP